MWINLSEAEVIAITEMESLPDRAAGIVGAAMLDARLLERLKREAPDFVIKSGRTLHGDLFRQGGVLGDFGVRISLGFILKIYDEKAWRDLHTIQRIRNSFAHQTETRLFSQVQDQCANLTACDLHFSESPHGSISSHGSISAQTATTGSTLLGMHIYMPDIVNRLKDPRQRYLLCVQYYSAFLKFPLFLQSGSPRKEPA